MLIWAKSKRIRVGGQNYKKARKKYGEEEGPNNSILKKDSYHHNSSKKKEETQRNESSEEKESDFAAPPQREKLHLRSRGLALGIDQKGETTRRSEKKTTPGSLWRINLIRARRLRELHVMTQN